ncbi:hypothetical protein ACTVFP_22765, partial [Escherichia coli]|uniref:hypothetical protein n=1 Tax=Escherichia coli TaxID=562 RepID=UPI003FA585BF
FLSAYDLLADAYEDLGNLEEAQATILNVLKASPRSSDRVLKLAQLSMHMKDWTTAEHAYARLIRLTRETSHEKVDYYYDYLKCLTNLLIIEPDNIKINDKFKRILYRLRSFGKTNPIAMSNSYRVEIQHYLANKNKSEAIRSWMQWQQLMKSGEATQLT